MFGVPRSIPGSICVHSVLFFVACLTLVVVMILGLVVRSEIVSAVVLISISVVMGTVAFDAVLAIRTGIFIWYFYDERGRSAKVSGILLFTSCVGCVVVVLCLAIF